MQQMETIIAKQGVHTQLQYVLLCNILETTVVNWGVHTHNVLLPV